MTDTARKWQQVFACLLLQALSCGAITSAYSVLAVPFAAEFGLSRMVVMLAVTALLLMTAICSPLAGKFLDQMSIRRLMFGGAIALIAAFALASFATAFSHIIVIYAVLMPIANILIGPLGASVLLSRWFDKDRGRALGISAIGISLGGFLMPPLIHHLVATYTWRPALQILAGIVLVVTLIACSFVRDRQATPPAGANAAATGTGVMTTGALLANREFWLMTIVFGVPLTGMMGLVTNMVPIARDRGVELATATLLISALSLGSLGGKIAFAALADRLSSKLILIFGVCGFFVGMSCFLMPQWGFGAMAAGAAIVGFTNGGAVPLQVIVCASTFGVASIGRAVGLLNTVVLLAGLLAPPGFGMIYDTTGSYHAAFILYLALAIVALFMVLLMRGAAASRAMSAAA